jgi:hypothetical protein
MLGTFATNFCVRTFVLGNFVLGTFVLGTFCNGDLCIENFLQWELVCSELVAICFFGLEYFLYRELFAMGPVKH